MYEYLPVLLGGGLPPYTGFNASVDPAIDPAFAVAAYRYGHSGIDSTYLCFKRDLTMCPTGHLMLRESYFNPAYFDWGVTIGDILRGLVFQPEGAIDTTMVADVRERVEGIAQDLAVLDVLRGRDFGLPSYIEARRELGLSVPASWADVTQDVRAQAALAEAYGDRLDKLDLWVGGLAESTGSDVFVGPTFRAIIRDQMKRLRDGDRMWYENTALTASGGGRYLDDATIALISATRLDDIIARNTDWSTATPESVLSVQGLREAAAVLANGAVIGVAASPSPAAASSSSGGPTGGATSSTNAVTVNSVLSLEWTTPAAADTTLTFTVAFASQNGWCSVGWGTPGMAGSDTWAMRIVNGAGADVVDGKASGYLAPTPDSSQDVTLVSATAAGGTTRFVLRRALSTGDGNDFTFSRTAGAVPIIFAWDTGSTTVGYHGGNKLSATLNLFPAASSGGSGSGANGTSLLGASTVDLAALQREQLFQTMGVHGLSMFIVWGVRARIQRCSTKLACAGRPSKSYAACFAPIRRFWSPPALSPCTS